MYYGQLKISKITESFEKKVHKLIKLYNFWDQISSDSEGIHKLSAQSQYQCILRINTNLGIFWSYGQDLTERPTHGDG